MTTKIKTHISAKAGIIMMGFSEVPDDMYDFVCKEKNGSYGVYYNMNNKKVYQAKEIDCEDCLVFLRQVQDNRD